MNIVKLFIAVAFGLIAQNLQAQTFKNPQKFKSFGRMQVNYGFGINDVFNEQKVNPLQIKFVFGKQNEHAGVGVGIATANFKSRGSNGGLNMNTISFSANGHYNLMSLSENKQSPFVRASVGYAAKVFKDYVKGLNYDAGMGYILTNKRGARYFVEAQYLTQDFEDFLYEGNKLKAESIGIGVGIWF